MCSSVPPNRSHRCYIEVTQRNRILGRVSTSMIADEWRQRTFLALGCFVNALLSLANDGCPMMATWRPTDRPSVGPSRSDRIDGNESFCLVQSPTTTFVNGICRNDIRLWSSLATIAKGLERGYVRDLLLEGMRLLQVQVPVKWQVNENADRTGAPPYFGDYRIWRATRREWKHFLYHS